MRSLSQARAERVLDDASENQRRYSNEVVWPPTNRTTPATTAAMPGTVKLASAPVGLLALGACCGASVATTP
jgi:hypothetical protein